MSVPAFSDIAKSSNDLLTRDFYHLSVASLEIKTKAPNGVAFTVKGKSNNQGPLSGSLETKYNDKATGLTLTQGWTTANVLDTKIELDEALTPGLKGELTSSFLPATGTKNAKLSLYFRQPAFHARAFFDLLKGPTFTGDVTVGHEGFLVGAEIGYDILDGKITKYSTAAGFSAPVYTAAVTATNNLNVISASYYHKVNDSTEAGAKATWDRKSSSAVGLEVGTKHKLDATAFAKAKVNSQGIATIAYSQALRPGVTLGLGLSADTQRLSESAHKIGFSLTFAA
jgi:voltage-dependent anion channel protein 2